MCLMSGSADATISNSNKKDPALKDAASMSYAKSLEAADKRNALLRGAALLDPDKTDEALREAASAEMRRAGVGFGRRSTFLTKQSASSTFGKPSGKAKTFLGGF